LLKFFFFVFILISVVNDTIVEDLPCSQPILSLKPIYLDSLIFPKLDSSDVLIQHYAYSMVYDNFHEQSKWVCYKISNTFESGIYKRTNSFKKDPLVLEGSASHSDYKGSGYDRGHLAPAADMTWSEVAMKESFYYSNMSPQTASFNRGVWKRLESTVRRWGTEFDSLYVTTGPVLIDSLDLIGSGVAVPNHFYKTVVSFRRGKPFSSISFVLENKGSKSKLENFVISTDSLEKISKIDFNYHLSKKIQDSLEANLDISQWSWY
jgi:endonuclease G